MPANLTPDYKAAEAAFRRARDPRERLTHLREMLRVIPKHKGTDHLQAEIKKRIKELTAELAAGARAGARTGPATTVAPEGAAQIALLGPPNSGKSALHRALTNSQSEVGPYPFTTQYPQPGMYVFKDIAFQLVDLPPLTREHPVSWIVNALQPADACLLVVDLGDPACVEQVVELHAVCAERNIALSEAWPGDHAGDEPAEPYEAMIFGIVLPTLLVATKADLNPDATEDVQILEDLAGYAYPALSVSAETGAGLDAVGERLAAGLEIVRVYTKIPGRPADMTRPFTVRHGETVADVARLVHREMAGSVRYARIWGPDSYDGQQVGRDHVVADGDVVELHT
jgi:ribosome-interacting GTPase 1